MVGVAEAQQVRHEHEQTVSHRAFWIITPAHGEPADDRQAHQRHRVHFFVHDRLIPHRERGGTNQGGQCTAGDALPTTRHPLDEHAFGNQEPQPGRHRARQRRQHIDPHGDGRGDRQDREDASDQHEERIARRMRNTEDVRGRDILAGVPHGRRRGQRDEVQEKHDEAGESGGQVRRAVIKLGRAGTHGGGWPGSGSRGSGGCDGHGLVGRWGGSGPGAAGADTIR